MKNINIIIITSSNVPSNFRNIAKAMMNFEQKIEEEKAVNIDIDLENVA